MVVVMMLILTATAMAAVQMRHLSSALRIEQARMRSEARVQGPVMVLAIACARLEAGNPPASNATYQYTHHDGIQSTLYRVAYVEVAQDRWTVTADPDPTAGTLPALPDEF